VKRHLEYQAASSNKFWEIEMTGNRVIARFGRIGTRGQTMAKLFADKASARSEFDRMLRQKLNKGYKEGARLAAPPPERRRHRNTPTRHTKTLGTDDPKLARLASRHLKSLGLSRPTLAYLVDYRKFVRLGEVMARSRDEFREPIRTQLARLLEKNGFFWTKGKLKAKAKDRAQKHREATRVRAQQRRIASAPLDVLTIRYEPARSSSCDLAGGVPLAWQGNEGWPACGSCGDPMTFVLQLRGRAAGGKVDLGPHAALQVFMCLNPQTACKPWQPLGPANAVRLRSGVALAPVEKPPRKTKASHMLLEPGTRTDVGADIDKIGGLPVVGNPLLHAKCPRCKRRLRFLGMFMSNRVPSAFGDGTAFLHICPAWHEASYQLVR
jgi:predicted DNA-binding WGR domain protein